MSYFVMMSYFYVVFLSSLKVNFSGLITSGEGAIKQVRRCLLFLWVLRKDCVILLWHSLGLPYNKFVIACFCWTGILSL